MHPSFTLILFSNTALPWRRIHAYSGEDTDTSISGLASISLYTSFVLLVQNQSFPSCSKQNMNGRHFALPSRPTVAKYCTGFAFKNSTTFFMIKYLLCFVVIVLVTSYSGTISLFSCNVNSYIKVFVTLMVTLFFYI